MLIPRAGEQLGDFELIRRVGAGGMGVVYEAHQLSTGRRVALKILSPAMTREKNRLRFLREAEAAARLNHPNIVAVYAIRQDPELCYYAMEFVDGWPLSRVLERLGVLPPSSLPLTQIMQTHAGDSPEVDSAAETVVEEIGSPGRHKTADAGGINRASVPPVDPLLGSVPLGGSGDPPTAAGRSPVSERAGPASSRGPSILVDVSYVRQIVAMMRDIARALHYAHAQGVTHRDVKPDNLLLDHECKLHLVDFGLARVVEEDNITLTGELMGTPLYMSPEQVAAGRIGIDHRTDLYSLGVVMYHMLCLQPPYEAPTREALLRAIVIHAPPPLSSRNPAVPRALETIVHHAMEKDPDRRYPTGEALADDLDRWLEGKPISIRPIRGLRRWWRQASLRRRRMTVGVVALMAALSVALPVWRSVYHRDIPPIPADPIAAARLEAAREVAEGDWFRAALWLAELTRRGGSLDGVGATQAALVLNELPPILRRFDLADVGRPWDGNPTGPGCVFIGPDHRLHTWDLANDTPPAGAFGLGERPEWISYDNGGAGIWALERGASGWSLQCWSPTGQPMAPRAVSGLPRILELRTARSDTDFTIAVMTATEPPAATASGQQMRTTLYRFAPSAMNKLPVSVQSPQPTELSPDGQRLAAQNQIRDDVLEIIPVAGGTSRLTSTSAPLACFTFSHDGNSLAVADATGRITDQLMRRTLLGTPVAPSAGIRFRTPPVYMRFNLNGNWLLIVGTDTQVSPPYLRSIALLDLTTDATMLEMGASPVWFETFGRDAFFSRDGRSLLWWDDAGVSTLSLPTPERPATGSGRPADQPAETLAVPIRARFSRRNDAPVTDPTDSKLWPVCQDAAGRRVFCAEASGTDAAGLPPLSVWDLQTGERIWRFAGSSTELASIGLDPGGRYALAQSAGTDPSLTVWDLGDPGGPYPRSAPLPLLPVSLSHLRLARGPLVAVLAREGAQLQWSILDAATMSRVGTSLPARLATEHWLLSEDGSVLLEANEREWSVRDTATGAQIELGLLPAGATGVVALSTDGHLAALRMGPRQLRIQAPGDSSLAPVDLGPLSFDEVRTRFSRSGRFLATTDDTGHVVIYALADPQGVVMLDAGQRVREMRFGLNDRLFIAGHAGGRVSLWSIPDGRRLGWIEPPAGAPSTEVDGMAPFDTRIAVRDANAGLPALLATAFANRIDLWSLPDLAEDNQNFRLEPIGAPLTTTHGIVAIAFPPCDGGRPGTQQESDHPNPSAPDTDGVPHPAACERLLAVTDHAAVRWFDLSSRAATSTEWHERLLARTGVELDSQGRPARAPLPVDTRFEAPTTGPSQ